MDGGWRPGGMKLADLTEGTLIKIAENGTLYKSLIDGNTWAPDAYAAEWEVYTEA